MLERFLILGLVIGFAGAAWLLWRWWATHQVEELQSLNLPMPLAQQVTAGAPAVLYFSTEACVQCRLQQTPVLARFTAETGIVVHKFDAVLQAELAGFYGVMTVPTTVVLDRQRRPISINYGLASLAKLTEQVNGQSASA
ncbi:hypothetical protein GC175_07655 [bacterium]|nr:hypothetical protein [bacterium]